MIKIAIVGYTGLLGSAVYRYFKYFNSVQIIPVGREDINVPIKVDVCINCAGNSSRFKAEKRHLEIFREEALLIEAIIDNIWCDKLIHISSIDVHDFNNYGIIKAVIESKIISNKDKYKSIIFLRCSAILGKGLKKGIAYDALNNGKSWFTKDSKFQFITTLEVCEIIYTLLEKDINNKMFDVAGLGQIEAEEVYRIIGKPWEMHTDASYYNNHVECKELNNIFALQTSKKYLEDFLKYEN